MRPQRTTPTYIPRPGRRRRVTVTCEQCGVSFETWPSEIARRGRSFCSRRCATDGAMVSVEARFWANVRKSDGCWLWTAGQAGPGYVTGRGYGSFTLMKRRILAHRFSYELHTGPIPDGMNVLHHCDNPPCVRPDHLFLGTTGDNVADKVAKKRHNYGARVPQSRLTEEDVRAIFVLRKSGATFAAIAARYGVATATIQDVVSRRTWKHIQLP